MAGFLYLFRFKDSTNKFLKKFNNVIFRKQIALSGFYFQVLHAVCLQFEIAIFGFKTGFRPICKSSMLRKL